MKKLLVLLLLPGFLQAQTPTPCDLLIKNGKIIDGSGNSWYRGNLVINHGKIVSIFRSAAISNEENKWQPTRIIDAPGNKVHPDQHPEILLSWRARVIAWYFDYIHSRNYEFNTALVALSYLDVYSMSVCFPNEFRLV